MESSGLQPRLKFDQRGILVGSSPVARRHAIGPATPTVHECRHLTTDLTPRTWSWPRQVVSDPISNHLVPLVPATWLRMPPNIRHQLSFIQPNGDVFNLPSSDFCIHPVSPPRAHSLLSQPIFLLRRKLLSPSCIRLLSPPNREARLSVCVWVCEKSSSALPTIFHHYLSAKEPVKRRHCLPLAASPISNHLSSRAS